MPTVDHGLTFYSYWWLLYWKSSCLLKYTNKILVWGMLCLKFTSDVYCTMQLALFNQQAEHPHWYSKWCQTFLNRLFKGWMKVDLSNFPFFVNEKFQIAPNYSYGSSTINFSNVNFSWTLIRILSHKDKWKHNKHINVLIVRKRNLRMKRLAQ